MSNENWSPWIEWHGGECPLPDGAMHETRFRSGEEAKDDLPETSYWGDDGDDCDIIAYRYRIEDSGISDPDEEECLQLAYGRMNDESAKVSLDAMHHMDWSTTITDTPEEAAMVEDMVNGGFKQLRYQDTNGEDWIDEFARTSTLDEFRGAMRFTIGKYNRRAGKKDELIKEIEKMRDYCDRWLAYEKERL